MRYLILFLLSLCPLLAHATHNRAGEIIVRHSGDCESAAGQLTACATIVTYTETRQTDVDRDALEISWGDGQIDTVARSLILPLGNGIQRNEYTMCHVFPTFGRYFISFRDQNRVANVRNIEGGNSVQIPFSVYTVYNLTRPLINGCNNSPAFTQPPIDEACIGSVWTHNPGAFDVDGDSLAFAFTVPQRAPRVFISQYELPGAGNSSITINETTGQITWVTPQIAGEYNLAFFVVSYRNGQPLDTLIRDMQINVQECANDPPELMIPDEEICVVAGEIVNFDVVATAPLTDTDQRVLLTAAGRPLDLPNSPATFTPVDSTWQPDPETKTFRWATNCSHVSNQPYFIVFRAEDDFFSPTNGLSTVRVVSIKVVPPPPEDLRTEADDEQVRLSWASPYGCEDNDDPEFLGFTVWRREGSNPFDPDTCQTGLDGRGYTLLTSPEIRDLEDDRYFFVDTDIERGRTYCYRVVAILGRPIANLGLIFEEIESLPSEEVCVQLARDVPLLTNVDVTATGNNDGQIDVCWVRPSALALDTVLNTGPYRYVLSRADGQTTDQAAFREVATFQTDFFGEAVDTCFTDTGLNTADQAYSYRIELFVENESEPVGEGQPATSVRLNGAPTDNANDLSWSAITPWTNVRYDVLRRLPTEQDFTVLATVEETSYRDEGLENGEEYCYVIRAEGTYSVEDIPSPLINRSQEECLRPMDNVPPCPPVLSVTSVCDRGVDCTVEANLFNTLEWVPPVDVCGDDDVVSYRIYFARIGGETGELVAEIQGADVLTFDHSPDGSITGCYTITAVDANGNESARSAEVCVVICPIYDLPNAFTPNGDGQNDLFIPRGRCFVDRVDFTVFNRWGQQVFQTSDPALNWDGLNQDGQVLASGTYYYTVRVFEETLSGVVPAEDLLSGYIELFADE